MKETCISECNENGEVIRQDPQVTPIGCYIFNNNTINDTFNGLLTLNSPNRPDLTFPDPYINQNMITVGYCIKHCIDLKFNYAAIEDGINCRCGYANALQNYVKVDNNMCNKNCILPVLKGYVTYPCGGKGAYSVYKAEIQYYPPPYKITIEEKLNIMSTMSNVDKYPPHYKGCIEDDRTCDKRVLSDWCSSTETMTVDECINNCHKGNYTYAGLEARVQCFCGNFYDPVGRL